MRDDVDPAQDEPAEDLLNYVSDETDSSDDMDSLEGSNDSEDEFENQQPGARVLYHPRPGRMPALFANGRPLPDIFRLLAPGSPAAGSRSPSNDELIALLRRKSSIKSANVADAFQVCPREVFCPSGQKGLAYRDDPMTLDADFNISAPHMHACMIEGLEVQPGNTIMDIGSGCGFTTCVFAYLTGQDGSVVGLDTRDVAMNLSASGLAEMITRTKYTSVAGPARFEKTDAFIAPEHEGLYDRVHVGGSCPFSKIPALLRLLKPEGGIMVVPCRSELLKYTVIPGQPMKCQIMSHVCFGDLEVPIDADIALGHLERHRHSCTNQNPPQSFFAQEMASVFHDKGTDSASGDISIGWEVDEELDVRSSCTYSGAMLSSSPGDTSTPDSTNKTPNCGTSSSGMQDDTIIPEDVLLYLGTPDCKVTGTDFAIPAHTAVLQARSQLFRARLESGMADAKGTLVTLPSHFSSDAVQKCLDYLYTDEVDLDGATAMSVMHVAHYLGVPSLVDICQAFIISHLQQQPVTEAVDSASQVFILADELGLDTLSNFCAPFLAMHVSVARNLPSYALLDKRQVDSILAALSDEHGLLLTRLQHLADDAASADRMQHSSDLEA